MLLRRFSFAMASLAVFSVSAKVVIESSGRYWQFEQAVRLDTVLAVTGMTADVYWPAAALYTPATPEIEALRLRTLQHIQYLQSGAPANEQQLLLRLGENIKSWRLAKRQELVIDYDRARLSVEHNPLLTDGSYLLHVTERPKTISVFGAIQNAEQIVPHVSALPAQGYLKNVVLEHADANSLHLMQADGRRIDLVLAGSIRTLQEAQPGAMLFVPFSSPMFDRGFSELNRLIIELMQYRIAA